jgi:vacuolar-type H+-ATPase subunit I/STV1
MALQFYYQVMGEFFGPMTGHELRDNAIAGEVTPDTLVRIGDDGEWVPAAKLTNLFDENWKPIPHPTDVQEQNIAHAQWFIERDGNVVGPRSTDQLITSAKERAVNSTDRVRRGDEGEWHYAGTLPWLEEFTGKPPVLISDEIELGEPSEVLSELEKTYRDSLKRIDTEARELIDQGREMQALELISTCQASIAEVKDQLSEMYTTVKDGSSLLKHLGSQRLSRLSQPLVDLSSSIFEFDENKSEYESKIIEKLRKLGIHESHWCVSEIVVAEVEYMLAVLKVMVEPGYVLPKDRDNGEKSDE